MSDSVVVLGVPLGAITVDEAVERGVRGGLVLAPWGPGSLTSRRTRTIATRSSART
jgi:hypothetical protein